MVEIRKEVFPITVKNVIVNLAEARGMKLYELSEEVCGGSKSQVYTQLSRKDGMSMKVESLLKLLDALDAQIVIQPMGEELEMILDGEDE